MKMYEQICKAENKTVNDYVKLSLFRFLSSKENLKNLELVITLISEICRTQKTFAVVSV